MTASGSGWFMTARIKRSGRVDSWSYPGGVTERDHEFMNRVTEVLPEVAASVDSSAEATAWITAVPWFERGSGK